ncbi:MAG: hypothetical protein HY700_02090 [Gemmatimonadetes bacterium]|nr:hypothetical protein [Gemmatimonadota bacterium]
MNDDDDVKDLLAEAARLPRSIEPPEDLWPAIAERINQQKVVEGRFTAGAKRPWWTRAPVLAAAAVLLVMLSSVVTTLVLHQNPTRRPADPPTIAQGNDFSILEAEYVRASEEILSALEHGEVKLAPETREILERNLRIIDNAIDESRAALERDPANQELKDMILTTYQHKLDLLRRATSRYST